MIISAKNRYTTITNLIIKFFSQAFLGFIIFNNTAAAQTIYAENFNLPDGTTVDNGKTAWSRDVSALTRGNFFVYNYYGYTFFAANDIDGEGVWLSETLDISAFTAGVTISMDAYELGNLASDEYIRFYYKVNGGSEVLFKDLTGDFNSTTYLIPTPASVAGVTGSTLQLVVRIDNHQTGFSGQAFDNVLIKSTATNLSLYSRANGDWDGENNWSLSGYGSTACNCYPDANTDVYVGNSNTMNLNVTAYAENITIANTGRVNYTANNINMYVGANSILTLESGGTLSENGRTNAFVYFQGNGGTSQLVSNGGTFNVDDIYKTGTGSLQFNGTGSLTITNLRLESTGTVTNNLSGNLNISSLLNFKTSNSVFVNNGTMLIGSNMEFSEDNHTFTNNGTTTINNNIVSGSGDDNNLITNNSGAILNINNGITLSDGNMTINNYGTLNQTGNFTTIDTGSSFNNLNGGTWNWSYTTTNYDADLNTILHCNTPTNTFNYKGNGNQNIIPVTYSNLTLSGSGTKASQNNLDVNGNLTLTGTATLDVATGADNILLAGNWINSGGTFTEGTQTVTLDGNGDQTISHAAGETFNHLTINKSSGVVTLANSSVLVNGTLSLQAGNVSLGNYNLTIGASGNVIGGSSASYIITDADGELMQQNVGAGARTGDISFPVGGTAGSFTPLTINNSGTADNFGVKICTNIYSDGSCGTGTAATENVVDRSWFITEAVAGGSVANLTFQWNAGNELSGFDRDDLTVIHHNGTEWEEIAYTAAAGSGPYSAVATSVSSFSPFGLKTTATHTLPIDLRSFTANSKNNQVNLKWVTASEINNDYFTIEKTTDFKTFEKVATIKGKGTYNGTSTYSYSDFNPYDGVSYYRLKQTDYDEKFTYSELVSAQHNASKSIADSDVNLYPVPNQGDHLGVTLSNKLEHNNISLTIVDLTGTVVYADQVTIFENEVYTIDFDEKLEPGIYTLKLGNENYPIFKKFIVQK